MVKAFESIMVGLKEAVAYARGEPNDCIVHKPRGLFVQLSSEQQKRALEEDDGL